MWQGSGEIEIVWVSWDTHMHMEKVFCDPSRTSREKREMNGVWVRGLHLFHCPRPGTVRAGPVPESGLITFQAEAMNLQIVPDRIELACPCARFNPNCISLYVPCR